MARPTPLARLIDGKPGASGRAVAARAALLATPAVIVSNLIGAILVFVLIVWVLPTPEVEDRTRVILVNLVAAAIYVAGALVIGTVWGLARLRKAHKWLLEDRPPSEEERNMTLRVPRRHMRVNAGLWLIAAVVFTVLNLEYSGILAVLVGITVVLGGVTTSAATYLLTERVTRAANARALSHAPPERPMLPGVTTRAMLAWALGGGVPMLGLALVAVVVLGGRDVGEDQLALTALCLSLVSLAVGAFITWQAARTTAAPVMAVREAQRKVEGGDLEVEVPVFDGSELGLLQEGFNRMAEGLRERDELRDMFGRQVGEDVAREALERGIELGGEELEVAVVFVDLVGSTELAEKEEPTEVVKRLNDFFGVVVEVVEDHGGAINKFEGDAALAVFGAPVPAEDAASQALATARELSKRLPEAVADLDAGIGVSAGKAVAGNVGAESRFEYTVIGDPVNEAARLCDLAKEKEGKVLASAAAVERANEDEARHWKIGEEVELRGRSKPTKTATCAG